MDAHPFLIGYDIHEPRRLARALRIVRGVANGGQKSFYECWIDEHEHQRRLRSLFELIDPETDRIFAAELDPRGLAIALGTGTTPANPELILIE
ncbi:MAG: hypothetical protein KatS3mg125_1704 [Lysobacterales bacterium]|jgi:CRISPR-associated protein Cas2|nr:MAG: hypothetical protein KatS3mg125_1704 [Xanthomonadales bacterium]